MPNGTQEWSKYDLENSRLITPTQLEELLVELEPPLGFGKRCPRRILYAKLMRMNTPITRGDNGEALVDFNAALVALVRVQVGAHCVSVILRKACLYTSFHSDCLCYAFSCMCIHQQAMWQHSASLWGRTTLTSLSSRHLTGQQSCGRRSRNSSASTRLFSIVYVCLAWVSASLGFYICVCICFRVFLSRCMSHRHCLFMKTHSTSSTLCTCSRSSSAPRGSKRCGSCGESKAIPLRPDLKTPCPCQSQSIELYHQTYVFDFFLFMYTLLSLSDMLGCRILGRPQRWG